MPYCGPSEFKFGVQRFSKTFPCFRQKHCYDRTAHVTGCSWLTSRPSVNCNPEPKRAYYAFVFFSDFLSDFLETLAKLAPTRIPVTTQPLSNKSDLCGFDLFQQKEMRNVHNGKNRERESGKVRMLLTWLSPGRRGMEAALPWPSIGGKCSVSE